VLPKFVSQAAANENITVYGSGEQVRTFIDVRDCVEILDELRDQTFDVVNVGGSTIMDMRHLANKVKFELDSDSHVVNVPYEVAYPDGFEECPSRIPDLNKLNTLIAPRDYIHFRKTILDLAKEIRYEPVCR
jgi:UDP-glucose 4-epimerase